MASVAAELHRDGISVTGSDSGFYPPMSEFLTEQGVACLQGFKPKNLPLDSLIVVGNSISRGNPELEHALNERLPMISLPELIADRYLRRQLSLVVTGTHGKTTTAAMLAHILRQDERNPGWLIGGIPADLPVPCHLGTGDEFVIEGDEYDAVYWDKRPKFLYYKPSHAIINPVEFDHADIYPDLEAIELQFRRFVRLLPKNGIIVACADSLLVQSICQDALCRVITVGVGSENDWRIEFSDDEDVNQAVITDPEGKNWDFESKQPGKHNLMNALAATALAVNLDVRTEIAISAIQNFGGVGRRMELIRHDSQLTVYDDFAHHPTAIAATLETARHLHPKQQLWALLEPRSNTMVRNMHTQALIDALKRADVIMIGRLHRADSIPVDQRLDRKLLAEELRKQDKQVWIGDEVDSMIEYLKDNLTGDDVIVMMSNGSFDGLSQKLVRLSNIPTI